MSSTLYWSFLILIIALLAYSSLFSVVPLMFLIGAVVLGGGYLLFLLYRRRRSGRWEHSAYNVRFVGSIFLYVALFWTITGIFSNVKAQREFVASYEPHMDAGQQHGYTFRYVDYADCYEHIDSPKLNQFLRDKDPGRVKLVLETVKDFGRLRTYAVRSVESIAVNTEWIGGNPPWAELRKP